MIFLDCTQSRAVYVVSIDVETIPLSWLVKTVITYRSTQFHI